MKTEKNIKHKNPLPPFGGIEGGFGIEKRFRLLSTGEISVSSVPAGERENIQIDVIPFIRIEEQIDSEQIGKIRQWAKEPCTVIFTSKHAVNIVTGILPTTPPWDIYCINGATKRKILTLWKDASIIASEPNSRMLTGKILAARPEGRLLFFCGAQRMDFLPLALEAAQIPFQEIRLYTTIHTPMRIEKEYDGVLFFSPSEVHSFFSVNDAANIVCFSIGVSTEKALSEYIKGEDRIFVASRVSKLTVLKMAIQYFSDKLNEHNT